MVSIKYDQNYIMVRGKKFIRLFASYSKLKARQHALAAARNGHGFQYRLVYVRQNREWVVYFRMRGMP